MYLLYRRTRRTTATSWQRERVEAFGFRHTKNRAAAFTGRGHEHRVALGQDRADGTREAVSTCPTVVLVHCTVIIIYRKPHVCLPALCLDGSCEPPTSTCFHGQTLPSRLVSPSLPTNLLVAPILSFISPAQLPHVDLIASHRSASQPATSPPSSPSTPHALSRLHA